MAVTANRSGSRGGRDRSQETGDSVPPGPPETVQDVDDLVDQRPEECLAKLFGAGRQCQAHTPAVGEPPTFIPGAYKASQLTAEHIGGYPGSTWTDAFHIPVTAHFIGGCVIGGDAERGVIDPYHRVYNYPGLSIVDGSAISANLGVNPSLTITAQAEQAMAMWPNKGQRDTRPPQEEGYTPVAPVPPQSPAVPEHAPAALRLPAIAVPPSERRPWSQG